MRAECSRPFERISRNRHQSELSNTHRLSYQKQQTPKFGKIKVKRKTDGQIQLAGCNNLINYGNQYLQLQNLLQIERSMKQKKDFFQRKPVDSYRRQDTNNPASAIKKSIFLDEKGQDRDVRTCIDMERNKLRNVDKSVAQKIVANAQNKLLVLLKSKEPINCLKEKENNRHFRVHYSRQNQPRGSFFDQGKLEKEMTTQKGKRKPASQIFISPLLEYCKRKTQEKYQKGEFKKMNSQKNQPKKEYVKLSSNQKHKSQLWF